MIAVAQKEPFLTYGGRLRWYFDKEHNLIDANVGGIYKCKLCNVYI